ncbi:MAG TPA: cation:proton antiporter [Actinomycetota bacterium]|nr:cation:proton antiporter [Actinomycetota bacterium]
MQHVKPLGGHELLLLLVQFGLLLGVARALGEGARRLRMPSVVGELLAGLVLGPSILGALAPRVETTLFPGTVEQVHLLEVISWVGVIMLLILTGLETDIGLILRKGKGALAISAGGILVPFGAGIALASALSSQYVAHAHQRGVFMLFVGTAMSISAIPVIAKVLMDMQIIRRDVAQITLAAGMIDDTVGWILLSVVSGLALKGALNLGTAAQSILSVLLVFVLSLTVGRRVVAIIIRAVDNHIGGPLAKITSLALIALAMASLTQLLGLEAVLGAFLAGILVGQVKRFDHEVRDTFGTVALGIFAPVFFALSGLRVDLRELATPSVLAVGLLVLAVAILGKFIGVYAGARLSRLSHWESLSLGASMNARGAMEIIVATIGLSLGVLTSRMYSIILLTAIVTSLMAPPLLRWALGHVEMGEEEIERLKTESLRKESFVANLRRVLLPMTADASCAVAADLVRSMIGDEEVEITTLRLEPEEPSDADEDLEEELVALELADQPNTRALKRRTPDGAAAAVLAEAEKGYDLLVVGTDALLSRAAARGEAAAVADIDDEDAPLFSPYVDELIQKSPCPVFIVSSPDRDWPAPSTGNRTNILLPVWGHHGVSRGAEVAFSIARSQKAVVDILHPVEGSRWRLLRSGGTSRRAEAIGRDLVARLAEFAGRVGATVETEVAVAENPERKVVEVARKRAALIVLETTRAPVSRRAFFGHDIDYLLQHAPCPVALITVPEAGAVLAGTTAGTGEA